MVCTQVRSAVPTLVCIIPSPFLHVEARELACDLLIGLLKHAPSREASRGDFFDGDHKTQCRLFLRKVPEVLTHATTFALQLRLVDLLQALGRRAKSTLDSLFSDYGDFKRNATFEHDCATALARLNEKEGAAPPWPLACGVSDALGEM